MSDNPKLAGSVYVRSTGRTYLAGMTAGEIGPAAAEIGDHAWEGGKAPSARQVPKEGDPDAGAALGTPPVPTPSGLPGGDATTTTPLTAAGDGTGGDGDEEATLTPPATTPDGMGGDGTTPVPGATADSLADTGTSTTPAPGETADSTTDADTSAPPRKATPAKRTGSSRTSSGS